MEQQFLVPSDYKSKTLVPPDSNLATTVETMKKITDAWDKCRTLYLDFTATGLVQKVLQSV